MSGTPTTDSEARRSTEAVDRFYRSLANHRRRIAIRILEERRSTDLEALAEEIAARESGEPDREPIEISLVHKHLPLLEEAGIVVYDGDTGRVSARSTIDDVCSLARAPSQ